MTGPDTGGSSAADGPAEAETSTAGPGARVPGAAARGGFRSRLTPQRLRILVAGNRLFVLVLIPAFLLRADAELGYRWQSWFNDSFQYMADVVSMRADVTRVAGYSVFLRILEPFHSYLLVTVLQHLMGMAVGVMVYALARHRFGARPWLATLAAVPVLYDGFQIQLEHLILSDVPFEFLLAVVITLLLWDRKPSWKRCALAGLVLGVADTVRSVGLPILAIIVVYIIIQRIGWRALAGTIVACLAPIVLYAGWFYADYGQFTLTGTYSQGIFLYSRVMTFAECSKMHVPVDELSLCTTTPPDKRPIAQAYIWTNVTPLDRFPPTKFSPLPNQLAQNFAERAILSQPTGYLKAVAHDVLFTFHWNRSVFPNAATYDEYLFRKHGLPVPSWAAKPYHGYSSQVAYYVRGNPDTTVVNPYAGIIQVWQKYVWLPGTVYGLILLLGLGGILPAWRRWGGPAMLPWTISVALIVIPAATAEFDYRYVLPAAPFACLATAMAFGSDSAARRWLTARRARPAVPAGAGADDGTAQELARGETAAS